MTDHPLLRQDLDVRPFVNPNDYPDDVQSALDHAHGTEDPVYMPDAVPRALRGVAAGKAAEFWLPEGHHFDLHIEHRSLESAGPYTGGGNKWMWHITVSGWNTVDPIWTVLRDKRAAPHMIIGGRPGTKHPVVIQCIPFNLGGRALAHPSGPETNRADCIQVEICANVADVPNFSAERYKAFANLVRLTNNVNPNSREVSRKIARRFVDTTRFQGNGFVEAKGHCGHMHVPGNDHTDPTTHFNGHRIINLLEHMPSGGYRL